MIERRRTSLPNIYGIGARLADHVIYLSKKEAGAVCGVTILLQDLTGQHQVKAIR